MDESEKTAFATSNLQSRSDSKRASPTPLSTQVAKAQEYAQEIGHHASTLHKLREVLPQQLLSTGMRVFQEKMADFESSFLSTDLRRSLG